MDLRCRIGRRPRRAPAGAQRSVRWFGGSFRIMFFLLFGGSGTGLFGLNLGMIPRMHARERTVYTRRCRAGIAGAQAQSRPPRGHGGCGFGAARRRRHGGGRRGKRRRAARRPAGVRRSRHGWSCLLQGGALRARVRERVGHSAAVRARVRPTEQQHGPT